MSSIVEIDVTAMRDSGGLAFYSFKHNENINGRSQVVFGFARPVDQMDALVPRALIAVIGKRR
ncbi:hypothetical protein, partial [Sphaerospermopsis aphanizomenoides]|uniref:hypothetical protein n=1 Tax=Sphaerospermopsis aphanizomenoides TaxID=459663 RepID=UPI001F37AB6B